jgi:hypothetical protein
MEKPAVPWPRSLSLSFHQVWLAYLNSSLIIPCQRGLVTRRKVSEHLIQLTCFRTEVFRVLSSNLASSWFAMDLTLFWFPPSLLVLPSWLETKLRLVKVDGCKGQNSTLEAGFWSPGIREGPRVSGHGTSFLKQDFLHGLRKWGRPSRATQQRQHSQGECVSPKDGHSQAWETELGFGSWRFHSLWSWQFTSLKFPHL